MPAAQPPLPRLARADRDALCWLLALGFLLQPVLGYLTTPVFTSRDGKALVTCTLQYCSLDGNRSVTLELPAADDDKPCPALQLLQLASHAGLPELPQLPSRTLYRVELLEQTAAHQHQRLHFSAYASRAPPLA